MNRFRALVFSICFSLCTITLAAQTPPPQKPEIEVPSSQTACDCHDLEAVQARIAKMDSTLKDWPELVRYREANIKIAPPAKNERRVVFMGDSITDAWVRPQFGGFFPGKPYIGRGISGQTTPQMLIRFRPDVIALQPKVVVILAGTNDIAGNTGPMSLEEIEANLASMSELARAHNIKVVLASVLPVYDGGHNSSGKGVIMTDRRPPVKILALNEWIKKYSVERKLVYLDYFSAMVDDKGFLKRELSEDGLHPNKAGYAVMAPLAEKAIQTALKM
jgi:lysophospholipase L1-like esterase